MSLSEFELVLPVIMLLKIFLSLSRKCAVCCVLCAVCCMLCACAVCVCYVRVLCACVVRRVVCV